MQITHTGDRYCCFLCREGIIPIRPAWFFSSYPPELPGDYNFFSSFFDERGGESWGQERRLTVILYVADDGDVHTNSASTIGNCFCPGPPRAPPRCNARDKRRGIYGIGCSRLARFGKSARAGLSSGSTALGICDAEAIGARKNREVSILAICSRWTPGGF